LKGLPRTLEEVFKKGSVKTRDEKSVFFLEERREDERFFHKELFY
jgi:hypothetical protein